MVRTLVLGAALAFGLGTAANAGIAPAPLAAAASNGTIVKVAEGCGRGEWRGPGGRCHPFAVGRACPPGYHLGPHGQRCWPN